MNSEPLQGMKRLVSRPLALLLVLAASSNSIVLAQSNTAVGISGTAFTINDSFTYPGTSLEGQLINSRMINAVFDDENPETIGYWAYPDTGQWDADRNTDEFIAALPSYATKGLKAFNLGMQGGKPSQSRNSYDPVHPWITSAFHPDGSLKPAWLERADRVIRAADEHGMVVILQYFYQRQEDRLINDEAVLRATDDMTDWVLEQGYRNVLIEVANESDHSQYSRTALQLDKIQELIARVQARSQNQLAVSTSFTNGRIPPEAIIQQSDYVLVHGNYLSSGKIEAMIDVIQAGSAYKSKPKPIVFNEGATSIENLDVAMKKGASWGYYEPGPGNYIDGFQSLPVNWDINTANKRAFFERLEQLAGVTTPTQQADLSVIQTDSADPVTGGENLTYNVTLTNNGASDATGVTLTNTLSSEVVFVSAPVGCEELSRIVTCDVGNLASGTSRAVSIVVSPTADGMVSNKASVTANEDDPNAANNIRTEETSVNAAAVPMANLSVTQVDSPDYTLVGNRVTYAVTVTNHGPDSATGVTVTTTLPNGVAFASAPPGCTRSGRIVVCNVGNLAKGNNKRLGITVRPAVQGVHSNVAQVSGNENDPASANNTDVEETRVSARTGVTCNGRKVAQIGTSESETIVGTAGADVIHGLGGNDIIRGLGGDDIICGGSGNDQFFGDDGNDRLFGGDGNDRLLGDSGLDRLDGGVGFDRCDGGMPSRGDVAFACEQRLAIP